MLKSIQNSEGIKATLVGAAANLSLVAVKFLGGLLGNSTAMIADAFHSLSDLLTDGIVLFTHQIGRQPKDANHPYGHGRAETIGSTVVGGFIIFAGLGLGYDVYNVIASGSLAVPAWIAAFAAVLSILTNEGLFHYTRRVGERTSSPSITANAWHHRSDAISSVAALIGISGAMMGYPLMDPLAGGVVALMILKVGFEIAGGGLRDLMDTSLEEEDLNNIKGIIQSLPGVIHSHDLRTRKIGGEILMDVHILVDPDLTVSEGHQIAESVRRELIKNCENVQDVLVHVDAEDDSQIEPLYPAGREELERVIDPIIADTRGIRERTRLLVHYRKGKNVVEVFVRPQAELTLEETGNILRDLKSRLEATDPIHEARLFVDVNAESP